MPTDSFSVELGAALAELRAHLEWQRDSGAEQVLVDRALKVAAAPSLPTARPLAQQPTRQPAPRPGRPSPLPPAGPLAEEERRTLDEVRRALGDCRRCKLSLGRTNVVYGAGSPRAELVFVGATPFAEEDQQGVPFVGASGELLTKMIAAMNFSRDQVYVCNVIKCRPPEDRKPDPEELAACEPFVRAQLASLRPKVIVALGELAAQVLLGEDADLAKLRGRWRRYGTIPLMATFHPADLLADTNLKGLAWSDLKQVMKLLGQAKAEG